MTPSRRPRGFTLIELLVVISILSLLVAIMLPALAKARSHAIGLQCLANIRQLGFATLNYVADHQETFIPFADGNASSPLVTRLLISGDYFPASGFLCPALAGRESTITHRFTTVAPRFFLPQNATGTEQDKAPDYGYNYDYLGRTNSFSDTRPRKLDHIAYPSRMLMFADSSAATRSDRGNHLLRPAFSTASLGVLAARHNQGVNAIFIDGHAATHGTGAATPPPHLPTENPYQFEPFNQNPIWRGQ